MSGLCDASRPGQGPRMLLLHGGSGSWPRTWQRSIPALATRFDVLAPDLPGFGASPDVPQDIGPAAYVDLVHDRAAGRDGTGPVHVVGFSFGGAVAAALAARLGSGGPGRHAVGHRAGSAGRSGA